MQRPPASCLLAHDTSSLHTFLKDPQYVTFSYTVLIFATDVLHQTERPIFDIQYVNVPARMQYGCILTPHAKFGSVLSNFRRR
jgi:hypothetical protein